MLKCTHGSTDIGTRPMSMSECVRVCRVSANVCGFLYIWFRRVHVYIIVILLKIVICVSVYSGFYTVKRGEIAHLRKCTYVSALHYPYSTLTYRRSALISTVHCQNSRRAPTGKEFAV